LNTLGTFLLTRFEHLPDIADLNKSISISEDAVDLTPDNHVDKPGMLTILGYCLGLRFELLGDQPDVRKAIMICTLAARSMSGPAYVRFKAASAWALIPKTTKHPSLLDTYHVALGLLPELAWLGLSITDRHYHLLEAGTVVRDAAAAVILSGQPRKAVEWLEQGRSIIWGQILNLRSPVDMLSNSYPELANQLLYLSARLERSGTRVSDSGAIKYYAQESPQSVADQAHQNAYRREELLKEIRGLEGFSRFLLPNTISELSQAAQQGAVVILNLGDGRCDALILTSHLGDKVMHMSLLDLTPEDAGMLAQTLSHLVGRGKRLEGRQEGQLDPEDEFEKSLAKLWLGVVKPVLDGLAITVGGFISGNMPNFTFAISLPITDSSQMGLSPYLVVSERSTCLSPHSCRRPLRKG
jgi:hypothetical protein